MKLSRHLVQFMYANDLGPSSRTSNILDVVFEPWKYTPSFLMSRMSNRKSVFALAGDPMNGKL